MCIPSIPYSLHYKVKKEGLSMKQWNVYNKNSRYSYRYILLEEKEAGKIKKMYIFGKILEE